MKIPRMIVALLAVDLVLTTLVAYLALKPQPMVVVPGAQIERAVQAASPDEKSITSFGLLVAMNFDNFTHTTVEEQDGFVLSKVSARFATELERVLMERKALVKESKMSSQIAIDPSSVTVRPSPSGFWDVEFRAVKQVFVADRLSWRDRFEYRIAVEAASPTRSNPYGLALAGISIAKVGGRNAEDR